MNSSKKILIVSNTSWYLYNFRRDLIDLLSQLQGVEIEILAPKDSYSIKLIKKNVTFSNLSVDRKGRSVFKELVLFLKLFSFVLRRNPDLVINYTIKPNIYMGLVGSILDRKYINNITGLGTAFNKQNFFTKFIVYLYRVSFKRCETLLFQNDVDQKLFLKNNIVAKSSTVINGSGVDVEYFKSDIAISQARYDFVMIARLLKDKGVVEFFDASEVVRARFPDVKIALVGDIDKGNSTSLTAQELKAFLKSSGVEYLGHQDDMKSVYESAKAIVLPSYREGFSRVLLEGASMERVLLASDVPGCKEIAVAGVSGLNFKARDHEDLAQKMIQFLEMSIEEKLMLAKNARKLVVKNFSTKVVNEKYLKVFKKVLGL